MRWRTAVTDDSDDKTQGRFRPMSRAPLVSPPNWPPKDVEVAGKPIGQ
jgi:hypothetical protein